MIGILRHTVGDLFKKLVVVKGWRLNNALTIDEEGIASTLTKLVGRSLAEVTLAATTAALTRPDQRTPAIIALGGAHWATPGQRTEPPPRWTGATCEICGRGREVHNQMNSLVYPKDRHEWMDPIDWNRIESNKAAAPLGVTA